MFVKHTLSVYMYVLKLQKIKACQKSSNLTSMILQNKDDISPNKKYHKNY